MDKIEKVKEWVKKQKKEELARNSIGVITGKALFVDANELLSFLDTLSEEPDKSLEEAAKQFVGYDMDTDDLRDYEVGIQAFIAGSDWKESQMLKESPKKEIEEFMSHGDRAIIDELYRWRFTTICQEYINQGIFDYGCAKHFAEWQRDQMLKDAVEGKIYGYGNGSYELVVSWLDLPEGGIYKDGDKVRIVVLKEEG